MRGFGARPQVKSLIGTIVITMKALRVNRFGGPEVLSVEEVPKPEPAEGQVLIQVNAAGVGPWDAAIRSGRSALPQSLPLTLGSDIAGIVDSIGPGVHQLNAGDEVFGVADEGFTGGCAEYALARPAMVGPKPDALNYVHAASVPVVAVTAYQMVFEHAHVSAGQSVLVHGGAGNVGQYAVQLAKRAGALVIATAGARDLNHVREIGADGVIDFHASRFEERVKDVDVVIDTIGGDVAERSYAILSAGGVLVSCACVPSPEKAKQHGIRAMFFHVQVTADRLTKIGDLIDAGRLKTEVGEVLSLGEARRAHEMLGGAPHRRGKIVLHIAE
jgi:NADPH:quinone reductase-like Zn-dependent oxidoreductase